MDIMKGKTKCSDRGLIIPQQNLFYLRVLIQIDLARDAFLFSHLPYRHKLKKTKKHHVTLRPHSPPANT